MLKRMIMVTAALWMVTSVAQADGVLPSIYVGVLGGVSASTADAPVDPYGVGIGLRGGLTIPTTDVYVGAFGLYHFGEEVDFLGTQVSSSILMVGGEGGYEFSFGPLVLRPSLGVGLATALVSVSVASATEMSIASDTDTSGLYLSPGVNFMVKLGILLGIEARYNAVVTDEIPDSVSVLGTLGFAI